MDDIKTRGRERVRRYDQFPQRHWSTYVAALLSRHVSMRNLPPGSPLFIRLGGARQDKCYDFYPFIFIFIFIYGKRVFGGEEC